MNLAISTWNNDEFGFLFSFFGIIIIISPFFSLFGIIIGLVDISKKTELVKFTTKKNKKNKKLHNKIFYGCLKYKPIHI